MRAHLVEGWWRRESPVPPRQRRVGLGVGVPQLNRVGPPPLTPPHHSQELVGEGNGQSARASAM